MDDIKIDIKIVCMSCFEKEHLQIELNSVTNKIEVKRQKTGEIIKSVIWKDEDNPLL